MQRGRITRTDIEAFGTTAGCLGCNAIRSGKRAQAHFDPTASGPRNVSEQLQKVQSVWIEEVRCLNEALAKEAERNVRRRKEIRSTAGELAAPEEWKDVPIPHDPDLGTSQETMSRGERRIQKFESTEHKTTNNDENINGGVTH